MWTLERINKLRDESTREEGNQILCQAIMKYEHIRPQAPFTHVGDGNGLTFGFKDMVSLAMKNN
ncbi:hypothetical protein MJD09_21450 [bacterium]|nr:hypothetical protein [bacterium]